MSKIIQLTDSDGNVYPKMPEDQPVVCSDYYYSRNGSNYICYPPEITHGSISGGNTDNETSWWFMTKFQNWYTEIFSTCSYSLQFPSTYGSLYYSNVTMMLPTAFFTANTGNVHLICSVGTSGGSGGGIFSTNIHSIITSTGAVGFFVGTPVKNTARVQVNIFGFKY